MTYKCTCIFKLQAYYTKFLEVQLSHTQFSANPTQATPTSGSRLLHTLTDLVQATPTDSQAAEQLKRALELAVALWGDLPGDCDPGELCVCCEGVCIVRLVCGVVRVCAL